MIRLNVFMTVSEENKNKLLELCKELTAFSLKDEGCIAYDIYESSTRNNILMICETWENETSLEKHSNSEHFKRIVPQMHALSESKAEKFFFNN